MAGGAADDKPQEEKRTRSRLIVRFGALLVAHSVLVSVLCCIAGLIAFLLLPVLAKNTYISENALMPGSANPMFSSQDVHEASKFAKDLINLGDATVLEMYDYPTSVFECFFWVLYFASPEDNHATYTILYGIVKNTSLSRDIARFIRQHMVDVGSESYYHEFLPGPGHFFSPTNDSMEIQDNCLPSLGLNVVGIIRAPRGDGKEAIVLVTPYNSQNITHSEAFSLGIAFSIFSLLSRVTWLAKDIVWLAADSRYGEYIAVDSWLTEYHNPAFISNIGKMGSGVCFEENTQYLLDHIKVEGPKCNVYKRAGTMAAALVFRVLDNKEKEERDSLTIYAEASNGQMPNLDLINVVHYLAVHRQGLRVKIETMSYFLDAAWLKFLGKILQKIGMMSRHLNPKWKIDITSADYVEGTATLASSIYYQALGVPTGSHGAFRDYQVDAITLEFSPRFSLNYENGRSTFLLRGGRLIEGVIRSVNNLLEKFHQSFFLYLLTAPNKFVSVGVYMIPFALLIAPLPIVAAALFTSNDGTSGNGSWRWLQAAKVVFMIHLWAMIASLLPYILIQLPIGSPIMLTSAWVSIAMCTLLIIYLLLGSSSAQCGWKLLKSVMIAAASIGLGLMSIINFSTAQIGAMLIVPMCLLVQPMRQQIDAGAFVKALLVTCNLTLAVVGFPPVALLAIKGLPVDSGKAVVGAFWEWTQMLWSWNSATYLYLFWIHLPCWLLCLHIFLYPR